MSDIFNHELDAYESLDNDNFEAFNPLYYHKKVEYNRIIHETEKAILFSINDIERWVPKSVCRYLTDKTVYIHHRFIRGMS